MIGRRSGGSPWRCSLCLALWLLPLGPVAAELRVLLVFDADGYRVERVVRGEASVAGRLREHQRARKLDTGVTEPASGHGEATLTWLDEGGTVLAVERMPDPRLARVPAPDGRVGKVPAGGELALDQAVREGVLPERVELERGSWIARGPAATTALLLRLPGSGASPRAPDEWLLELDARARGQADR